MRRCRARHGLIFKGFDGAALAQAFGAALALVLAGCSGIPQTRSTAAACAAGEASWECQIERYHNVNAE